MTGAVYISDEIATVAAKVDTVMFPILGMHTYYMFGHPLEIVTRLQELSSSITLKDKKFPLIALFTDIPVTKRTQGFYGEARLQMIVANITSPEYTAPQRLQNNFKPVLQPIKTELLKQISLHKQFTRPEELLYTEIERYYWGKQGLYGNSGNVFNDYIDCIELQNIQVTIKNKFCVTLSNHL